MNVLVLCTGNSCRSQIAEAFLRHHGREAIHAFSAGTEPAERVHPLAVRVMGERGISLEGQRPKQLDEYRGSLEVDTLITVCDSAAERCPIWPGARRQWHWPFEDPAAFVGDEPAKLAKFREVRDQIERRIQHWLEEPGSHG